MPSRPNGEKIVLPVIKQTILTFFSEILNLEGLQNRCIGSKVTAILLNGWIMPTGGVASGRVNCHILTKGPPPPLADDVLYMYSP